MTFVYNLIPFVVVFLIYIHLFYRISVTNSHLIQSKLSKKAFLVYYISSRNELRKYSFYLCLFATLTPIIATIIWTDSITSYVLSHPDVSFYKLLENDPQRGAISMDWSIVLVLWIGHLVLSWFFVDQVKINFFKFDPRLSEISKYQLINHPLLQKMLELRINFFWNKRLLKVPQTKHYSRKQLAWIYQVFNFYAVIANTHKLQKMVFFLKKDLKFSDGSYDISFDEMLKLIGDCFDHCEIDVNVVRSAKFGKTTQYLDQIWVEKANQNKETIQQED